MRVSEAYDNWSVSYDSDRNLTRDLDEEIARASLGTLTVATVLEIGCGTGKITRTLRQIAANVIALDLSPGMISQAKTKVSAPNVHFVIADLITTLPVASAQFDLAICDLVLEHVEDLYGVFAEVNRTLVSGGQFYVSELHPFRQYRGTVANFQRGETRVEVTAFVHHISDFLAAAKVNNFRLLELQEWWHEEDFEKPPRLVTFMFEKTRAG
jgi:ubiquinone/menaquinone biosynthesis C-methylase UbiE